MELNLNKVTGSPSGQIEHVKVLIIGGGPAGLSAALYAGRAELKPVVLTGMELGGQVALTHMVENYPGFPEGVGGAELTDLFKKQAERFGGKLVFDTATAVDFSERPFKIDTYNGKYTAETVIIATGAAPRHLEIPGEEKFTGRGVSYCGTCDGFFFKDKDVLVVGGGDSALEEGIFLTRFANSVTVVHRRDELRGGAILELRAKSNPKIDFIWDSIVTEINGDDSLKSVQLKNVKSGEISTRETDGLFIFIGHLPNTEMFRGQLELDDNGYIKTNQSMETKVPGVFVAGEVADSQFRQVITSAGMGAAAAIKATRFLEALE
jgi:thioredoxin reductase (NADPH)